MSAFDQLRVIRNRTLMFLHERKTAYRLCFGSPAGAIVLADLHKFCRAGESVFDPDVRLTDIAIGRHEVWLKIVQHLRLTEEQLLQLYNGEPIQRVLDQLKEEDDNG